MVVILKEVGEINLEWEVVLLVAVQAMEISKVVLLIMGLMVLQTNLEIKEEFQILMVILLQVQVLKVWVHIQIKEQVKILVQVQFKVQIQIQIQAQMYQMDQVGQDRADQAYIEAHILVQVRVQIQAQEDQLLIIVGIQDNDLVFYYLNKHQI